MASAIIAPSLQSEHDTAFDIASGFEDNLGRLESHVHLFLLAIEELEEPTRNVNPTRSIGALRTLHAHLADNVKVLDTLNQRLYAAAGASNG